MSEKHQSHEQPHANHESTHELNEHHERLAKHHEKSSEKARDGSSEQDRARHEAREHAISGNEYHKPHSEKRQHTPTRTTKEDKKLSFDTTMHHVRNNLSTSERALSKIIHKPLIEKTSEIASNTIARPSGVAGATALGFVGLLLMYGVARFAGFELSGSEMPILLILGFILGLLLELLYKSFRAIRNRNSA